MSSRICRDRTAKEIQAIQWRSAGGAPALVARNSPGSEAQQEDASREAEAKIAAAYQRGVTAGEAAAAQRMQAELDPVLASLSGMLAELAGLRKKFRGEAEGATVELAMAIARRVLHRELAADPEALLGLVKAAFQKCDARETHRLRLSPADAGLVNEQRARLNLPPAVEIAADASLPRGSAVFETSRGELDASFDTQLDEIEHGLADLVRRRQH